jgi:hypothetical protein
MALPNAEDSHFQAEAMASSDEHKELRSTEESAHERNGAITPILVGWEEPEDQDPASPLNWSATWKWGNIAQLSALTFLTYVSDSIVAFQYITPKPI